jgi:hypothetical protein
MFMDPKVRRTIILLSKLRTGEQVWLRRLGGMAPNAHKSTQFSRLEEDSNRVVLAAGDGEDNVSLDAIETVYAARGGWIIVAAY